MILTKRDKLIINLLKHQEFCLYKDIKNKFFPSRSSFTHVLYVIPHANKIAKLIKDFKYYRFFGLSHYANLDEVSSFWHAQVPLKEWLNKSGK